MNKPNFKEGDLVTIVLTKYQADVLNYPEFDYAKWSIIKHEPAHLNTIQRLMMIDGFIAKMSGGIYISVDLAKDGDTCCEWQIDSSGIITILDVYKSNERNQK